MRKVFSVLTFSLVLLLIGRNLTFLPRFELFQNKNSQVESLREDIKSLTSKQTGNYSVYYKSFNLDTSFGINEDQQFTAASVNKVPIVLTLYYLASKGKIDINENIVVQKDDLQDYGTGRLRYEEPGKSYSLKSLAKLALNESDNTASYILATKIGIDTIQQTVDNWGMSQTDIANNKTSLTDMYVLFFKLYKNEIVNEAQSKELLGFMKNTSFEDRLPLKLGKGVTVYHKTGDTDGGIHDVGIVIDGKNIFFVGVFTADIADTNDKTKDTIGTIAKKILDFQKNLQ